MTAIVLLGTLVGFLLMPLSYLPFLALAGNGTVIAAAAMSL